MIYLAIKFCPLLGFLKGLVGVKGKIFVAQSGWTFVHNAPRRLAQTQRATSYPYCLLTEKSGFSFQALSRIWKWFISRCKSYARTRFLQVVEARVHGWPLYRYYWSKANCLQGLTDFEWATIGTTIRKWVGSHNSRPPSLPLAYQVLPVPSCSILEGA